jgi:predicted Zn-dependent protease
MRGVNASIIISDNKTIQYLTSIQDFYDAESVVGITSVDLGQSGRNFAFITKNSDKSLDNKIFIDRFVL